MDGVLDEVPSGVVNVGEFISEVEMFRAGDTPTENMTWENFKVDMGVENLAAAIGEERDTIEDVIEPYLIQQGFLMRTPRGRVATPNVYRHFGLKQPVNEQLTQATLELPETDCD